MNETFADIINRRSIRKYENKPVPREMIFKLLQAAMNAPSACNQQPWHFVIIEDKNILDKISRIHGGFTTIKNSPVTILVCGQPDITQLEFFWQQDCSAATQNIHIAAKSLGLGSVWMGINPNGGQDSDIIREALNLPDNIKPFSLVSVGFPAESRKVEDRFNESRIHYNNVW
ncbi:MAG: nitroreductase family protein [Bacillota bacterium]|nr:nitroreductase family protein [Bacillota bacterium]